MSHVTWTKGGFQNDLMLKDDNPSVDATTLATCAVVGMVSSERLYLEGHGNYNPKFNNSSLETSKYQFQLVAPTFDPDFESDFNIGIERLELLQSQACTKGPAAQHFIVSDDRRKALRFNWPLFEKRVSHNNGDLNI
jgi:hypothetical protein